MAGDGEQLFCEVCERPLEASPPGFVCAACTAPPRVRTLAHFATEHLPSSVSDTPVLAFAMGDTEKAILDRVGIPYRSVSLYGSYRSGHERGVDARDLGRYDDTTFAGVYGCLLYDYFLEHEVALAEAFRVTAPGGWFATHIAGFRLSAKPLPPETIRVLEPEPGFYDYLPSGAQMLSVRVGADWFLDAMKAVGYADCTRASYVDTVSQLRCDWFYGRIPERAA